MCHGIRFGNCNLGGVPLVHRLRDTPFLYPNLWLQIPNQPNYRAYHRNSRSMGRPMSDRKKCEA